MELARLGDEREPGFVAMLCVAFALKVAAVALALALSESWGRRAPRRLLLLGWTAGVGVTLYAVLNFAQHALMAAGAIDTPDGLGSEAFPGIWRCGIRSG